MRLRFTKERDVRILAGIVSRLARGIYRTLRLECVTGQGVLANLESKRGQILCTWHGAAFLPAYYLRGKGLVALTSPSRDGEFVSRFIEDTGGTTIRGSSGRFGSRSALTCVRALQKGATLAIAPDGPKGPRGSVQPGLLYLAMKSGVPIYPAGVAARPAWHLKTWDRHLLPKPFGRAVVIFGDPIHVPSGADDAELAQLTKRLGATIDELERRAEAMVGSGQAAVDRL